MLTIRTCYRPHGEDEDIDYVFGLLDISWWYYTIAILLGVVAWWIWKKAIMVVMNALDTDARVQRAAVALR